MGWTEKTNKILVTESYPLEATKEQGTLQLSVKQIVDYAGTLLHVFHGHATNTALGFNTHAEKVSLELKALSAFLPGPDGQIAPDAMEQAHSNTKLRDEKILTIVQEPQKILERAAAIFENAPFNLLVEKAAEKAIKLGNMKDDPVAKSLLENKGEGMAKALRFAKQQLGQRIMAHAERASQGSSMHYN